MLNFNIPGSQYETIQPTINEDNTRVYVAMQQLAQSLGGSVAVPVDTEAASQTQQDASEQKVAQNG